MRWAWRDDSARLVVERQAGGDPAIAQLAILGEAQALVEAADLEQRRTGQGEVVAREEPRPRRFAHACAMSCTSWLAAAKRLVRRPLTTVPPTPTSARPAQRACSAASQPGSGSQSSSVNATSSPPARATPSLRAADGPRRAVSSTTSDLEAAGRLSLRRRALRRNAAS